MSDAIHSMLIKNASAPDIRYIALEEGMSTLQETGWAQIKRGFTSFEEVIRYADGIMDEEVELSADVMNQERLPPVEEFKN